MIACASMGSPSFVPVPCASRASTSAVRRPALASACRMTRCCDGPSGYASRGLVVTLDKARERSYRQSNAEIERLQDAERYQCELDQLERHD